MSKEKCGRRAAFRRPVSRSESIDCAFVTCGARNQPTARFWGRGWKGGLHSAGLRSTAGKALGRNWHLALRRPQVQVHNHLTAAPAQVVQVFQDAVVLLPPHVDLRLGGGIRSLLVRLCRKLAQLEGESAHIGLAPTPMLSCHQLHVSRVGRPHSSQQDDADQQAADCSKSCAQCYACCVVLQVEEDSSSNGPVQGQ